MATIQAPQRTIPLGEQQRGQNGTVIRVRRVTKAYGLPFIARYCVEWQTVAMAAPAFWYYPDRVEANTDALRLLGERKG